MRTFPGFDASMAVYPGVAKTKLALPCTGHCNRIQCTAMNIITDIQSQSFAAGGKFTMVKRMTG
jgi:hypothetical protein